MAVSFTTLQSTLDIEHGDLRFLAGLLGHGNPFHEAPERTVIVLTLLPEAVLNLVVSVETEMTDDLYALHDVNALIIHTPVERFGEYC